MCLKCTIKRTNGTLSLLDIDSGEQFWLCYEWVAFDNKASDYSHIVLNLEEDQGTRSRKEELQEGVDWDGREKCPVVQKSMVS